MAINETYSFISNGTLRLGVYRYAGGAISWLEEVATGHNIVADGVNGYPNAPIDPGGGFQADAGAQIQPAYYGKAPSPLRATHPWHPYYTDEWPGAQWNPVQTGDAGQYGSPVLDFANDGSSIYCKSTPLDWSLTDGTLAGGFLETWISFVSDRVIKCRYRYTYEGPDNVWARDFYIEAPTNQLQPEFIRWSRYAGSAPWTNGPLTEALLPPDWTLYDGFTEPWVAVINESGLVYGTYTPKANMVQCQRARAGVGYCSVFIGKGLAGSGWFQARPANRNGVVSAPFPDAPDGLFRPGESYEFVVYLTLGGTVADVRARFYALHAAGADAGAGYKGPAMMLRREATQLKLLRGDVNDLLVKGPGT